MIYWKEIDGSRYYKTPQKGEAYVWYENKWCALAWEYFREFTLERCGEDEVFLHMI